MDNSEIKVEMQHPKDFIPLDELSAMFSLSGRKFQNLINDPNFPKLKIGKLIIVPRKAFQNFIENPSNLVEFTRQAIARDAEFNELTKGGGGI